MEVTKRLVANNLGSFIAVLIGFGIAWKYLDEQRVEVFKVKEEAIKLKAEADVREQYLKKNEEEFSARNTRLLANIATKEAKLEELSTQLGQKEKSLSVDAELRQLSSKYLDESSTVDIAKTCGDNEEHNEKVRKAKAILTLIESTANLHNRQEFISFAKQQREGIYSWEAKCKP
jgi:hypothetical protein